MPVRPLAGRLPAHLPTHSQTWAGMYTSGAAETLGGKNKLQRIVLVHGTAKVQGGLLRSCPMSAATALTYHTARHGRKRLRVGGGRRWREKYTNSSFNQGAGVNFDVKMGNGTDAELAYDANGNIKQMQQWGLKITGSTQIDNLTYNYFSGTNRLQSVADAQVADNKLGDFTDKNTTATDYGYDKNGNLVTDLNKRINGATGSELTSGGSITYNHLNLPSTIAVKHDNGTHKGTITYTYDATGNKLKKEATEDNAVVAFNGTNYTTNITTTTSYIGSIVYESKTHSNAGLVSLNYPDKLQFIGHEEGRMRPLAESFAYDYMLKDHLGNVRMVLTEEQKTDAYPPASMETAQTTTEEALYANLPQTRINKPAGYPNDTYTNPNDNVAKTSGSGNKIGPAITLKVMAGDKLNIRVSSWYKTYGANPQPPNPITELGNALAYGLAGASGGKATATDLINGGISGNAANSFLGSQSYISSRPKAFINWMFLDEQFKYYAGSVEQVGSNEEFKTHVFNNVPVNKSGYLYVYVSNETPNIDVFFDNLQVTHIRGAILEESHYYPFGLTMSGISSKALNGAPENKKKFIGQQFDNEIGLNWYQFRFRNHDPQIGRFIEIDPLADKYVYNSTYTYAENKVGMGFDLEGLELQGFNEMFRAAGINVDYQNRKVQAQVNHFIEKAQPVIAVTKDVITIAAGVTLLVASAGTATPLLVGLAGSATVTGGTMKLVFDLQGNTEASEQIPTTLSGTAVFLGNGVSEATTGNKLVSDDVKTVLEFGESMLTLSVTGFDKMSDVQKASNALSGLSVTLDGLSPELGKALQNLLGGSSINNQIKIIPQTNIDNTGKKPIVILPEVPKTN